MSYLPTTILRPSLLYKIVSHPYTHMRIQLCPKSATLLSKPISQLTITYTQKFTHSTPTCTDNYSVLFPALVPYPYVICHSVNNFVVLKLV